MISDIKKKLNLNWHRKEECLNATQISQLSFPRSNVNPFIRTSSSLGSERAAHLDTASGKEKWLANLP
jgi:hypothetical protein